MHVLDHKGENFSVRGPLNIARPPQGWPVIVQAGASEAGRQLAAETAEMVFAAAGSIEDGAALLCRCEGADARAGPHPEHLKILPGALVIVGETMEEARAKKELLDSLVHPDSGLASLSVALGCDASGFDLDAPLPEMPQTNAEPERRANGWSRWRSGELTVRQLAQHVGGYAGLSFVGTPAAIADTMEEWLEAARLRRFQRDVPVPCRRAGRVCRHGRAGAAAARPVPQGI